MANQIKFNASEMAEYCKVFGKVVSGKGSMPIYESILFRFEGRTCSMVLYASDGTTHVSVALDKTCGFMESSFCVPFAWLKSLCDGNPCATITLDVLKGGVLVANTCDGVVRGVWYEASAFEMSMAKGDVQSRYSLSGKAVLSAVSQVSFARATDDVRLTMTGVCLDAQTDDIVNVVATDGRLMAIKAIVAHDCNGLRLMLPKHIISLLSSVNAHDIELTTFEDNFCVIEADEYTIYFSTIEGRYPNYLSVKPSLENASRARCSRHALMAAIKRMQTMGNTCSGLTILTFGSGIEGGLTLRSCDNDRGVGIRESLPAFTSHVDTFSIGVCAAFALNVLSRLSGNTVHLYTTTDDRPVSFIGADETFYALTMPMALAQTPEEFDKDYIEQIDEDDEEAVDDQSADVLADEIEENEESTEEKEDEL